MAMISIDIGSIHNQYYQKLNYIILDIYLNNGWLYLNSICYH